MHHGKRFLVGMLLSLFVVGGLFAQGTSVSGFAGVGLPMSPSFLKDNYKSGLGFGGNITFKLNERTALSLGYQNQTFGSDFGDDFINNLIATMGDEFDIGDYEDSGITPEEIADLIELGGLNAKTNIITANLVHYLSPSSSGSGIYVTGGVGYYMMKIEEPEISINFMGFNLDLPMEDWDSETKNKIGINAGLGFELLFGGNMFLFVEGKYHFVFTDAEDLIEIEEGEDELLEAFGIDNGKVAFLSIVGGLRIPLN